MIQRNSSYLPVQFVCSVRYVQFTLFSLLSSVRLAYYVQFVMFSSLCSIYVQFAMFILLSPSLSTCLSGCCDCVRLFAYHIELFVYDHVVFRRRGMCSRRNVC